MFCAYMPPNMFPMPKPSPAPIADPAMPGFFAASLSASACAICIYVSIFPRIMPSEVFLSKASSSSFGMEKFSNTNLVSSMPICSKEGCMDFLTISPSSKRFPAISRTGILLSPIASDIPLTTMLLI